jgi:hypothetical protein
MPHSEGLDKNLCSELKQADYMFYKQNISYSDLIKAIIYLSE